MAWRSRHATASAIAAGKPGLSVALPTLGVILALGLACVALLLTAPVAGDFWNQDAPRHALNGVFIRDFVAAHPIADPMRWAIDYYLKRPALTIVFYPPLFYCVEAIAFALFGVSQFVAQATVTAFIGLLAGASYLLSRTFLPRWSAVGASLLVIAAPEAALWGRQVMLDLPAYALIVTSACFLARYLENDRPRAIYLTALFLVAAIYTKYNAGFVAPAFAAAFVMARGKAAWRDGHAMAAAGAAAIGLVPAILVMLTFGAKNIDSVSGLRGALPLDSLAAWLFYLEALPSQLGWLTLVLAAGGLVVISTRALNQRDRWGYGLLLAWLLFGYLIFSAISLKEPRDTIMVLLPLAIAAPVLLLRALPRPLGEAAGLVLGAGTLAYTLLFCPVPRLDGYEQIAAYLAKNVPPNGVVVYSGYRDANLVFDLAAIPGRSDIAVIRTDKLLLSVPFGEPRRGVKQASYDQAAIAALLRNLGASYFVVQPGFWSAFGVMARFGAVIGSQDYEKIQHFDVAGTFSDKDNKAGVDVFRPTYKMTEHARQLDFDMPITGQRFQGAANPK
ncbi:MAG TPA: glycosyltransferase family 39 protein [Rhodopila sp.]|nr:glycosyltransferase family 39 protein [Rhodopila sp.]